MTLNQIGTLGFLTSITLLVILIPALLNLSTKNDWYEQGWRDCYESHKRFEMSADDYVVLKHLKKALRAYIKSENYQTRGDVKKVAGIENFDDLNHVTWEICQRESRRKEKRCSKQENL